MAETRQPHDCDRQALEREITRRHFFGRCAVGLGGIALASMLGEGRAGDAATAGDPLRPRAPHHHPRARAVIYLHMAGAPSQLDLFEDKPRLRELHGQPAPASFLEGKQFAFLKGDEKLLGTPHTFGRYGESGAVLSDLLPFHRRIADKVCFLKGMRTDVFNHGPAKVFMNTGSPQPGRPSMGSWVTYGIGSSSRNLPGFVVLQSGSRGPRGGSTLWSNGFLPGAYQGVPFRSQGDPILHLSNPPDHDDERQRAFFDTVTALNHERLAATGDPEIATRIAAYEMAYRMQSSAPELIDLSQETAETMQLYGAEAARPSFARNCVLARRLVERGVRFVQLYHANWDHHGGPGETLERDLPPRCKEVDQASAALVLDLERRGLLEDTLVVWGGEFGRTPMGEVRASTGRDHHIEAFTMWLAGGGIRAGMTFGETDELGYSVVRDPVHVHDLHATILHLLGLDHERLTFRSQGRDFRLTDVSGNVVREILV